MKKNILYMVLVLSFALAACGSAKPANTPTTAPANFPVGKFFKSGLTDYGLIFNKDGTFTVFNGSATIVSATYKVDGNVFTETSNNGGCATNVNFNYVFDGKNLTFTYVGNPDDDSACAGRHTDFNSVTYTLSD